MWITRNKSGTLVLWFNKPVRQGEGWYSNDGFFILNSVQSPTFGEVTSFPEITWENSPKKVELVEEDLVEKACKWLDDNLYTTYDMFNNTGVDSVDGYTVEELIEEFRKAMKNPS